MDQKSEVELVKVQVFANYCEGQYNVGISATFASFLGLLVAFIQIVYQYFGEKTFGLTVAGYFSLFFGITILFVMFAGFLVNPITRIHELDIENIQNLLEKINKAELLPTLKELKKQRKQRNKRKRKRQH